MAKYMRSNSIRPDPHDRLLECVKRNNVRELANLLRANAGLLCEEYNNGLTILETACYLLADDVHADTVRTLLTFGADPTRCFETWESKSAIHFATMGQNAEILEEIASHNKVEINATTQGRNALHILIIDGEPTKNFEECVRVLCRHGIDFQWRDYKNTRAIHFAARRKYINIVKILLAQNNRVTSKEAALLSTLDAQLDYTIDDSDTLLSGLDYLKRRDEKGFGVWLDEHKDHIETDEKSFLQFACEQHLPTAVKLLIDLDPNKVGMSNKMHPLTMTVQNGHFRLVELFLDATGLETPSNLLNEALKRIDLDGNGRTIDYQRTCELILDHAGLDVNERDPGNGHYPLHYAVKYAGKEIVAQLLKRKASLANRDRLNQLTIVDVDHDTLKNHFDACIEAHPADPKDHSREGMYLTFDYTTLFPTCGDTLEDARPDCENKFLHKQKHSLMVKETDAVLNMTRDKEQKPLLQHPLIVSFLYAKWHRVRFLFLANLIVYLLFCASLLWFILSNYNEPAEMPVNLPFILLLLTAILISLREAFQIIFTFRQYFKSTDNYVELGLLVNIYVMLFSSSTGEDRRPMFAIAVLLTALELLFLFGSAPGMSTYIVMLRTVSYNFVKFLLFNAILILAFAFSFYTLFREVPSSQVGDEEKQSFFKSIYLAIFKTLIMLTGEFEAGELDFDQFPIASHVLFILFVFLIAIILLNLLNGLAVSDTQEIKCEAKLIALVLRARYVAHVEAMVFDHALPATCSCMPPGVRATWHRWILSRVCIAQQLDDGCLKVFPNQEGRIAYRTPTKHACTWLFGGDNLHEGTVKMAKTVITDRQHARNSQHDSNYQELFSMIQKLQHSLENKVESI